MGEFDERLKIEYNQYTGMFELWRLIIDKNDKLYPVHWRWLEDQREDKEMLRYLAMKKFSKFAKQIKFL